MLYVGLDVHSKQITVCVLDDAGKVRQRCQVQQVDQLMSLLKRLPSPFEVCFEASTGYGRLFELLCTIAARVVVAHPGLLKLIYRSKKKSDRRDAEKLAKLLYLRVAPGVHVPSAQVRAWRELITFRSRLIEKRTRVKNSLRMLLRATGVTPPERINLWTRKGLAWLKTAPFEQPSHGRERNLLLAELELLTTHLSCIERDLEQFSRDNVSVHLLKSIPGVGPRTAEAVVAFLDDPHRFANAKRVGAYFGLVPCQDQSGNKNRLGRITRDGSATVRRLLTEAAWQAIRRSPTMRLFYKRVKRDDPQRNKIALVATAHYLVRVMWAMLRDGSLWKESAQAA
jgi:transposase